MEDIIKQDKCIEGLLEIEDFNSDDSTIEGDDIINRIEINEYFKSNEGLKLFHSNIRSEDKNLESLKAMIGRINFNYHIIGLTETWGQLLKGTKSIDGYEREESKFFRNKCSGVTMYISKRLNYNILDDFSNLFMDSIFLDIKGIGRGTILVGVIYRPRSYLLKDFLIYWEELIKSINRKGRQAIIFGDFNSDILENSSHMNQDFINISAENGFRQLVNGVTRSNSEGAGTCIDLCFTNLIFPAETLIIHDQISDHYPFSVKFPDIKEVNQKLPIYKSTRFNKEGFLNDLANNSFEKVFNEKDINKSVEIFLDIIKTGIDKNTLILLKNQRYKSLRKPWITKSLLKSIRKRDRLRYKLNKIGNKDFLLIRYRSYRNILNMALNTAKKNHYSNQIKQSNNDTGTIWGSINEVLGNSLCKDIDPPSQIRIDNNKILNNEQEIAEEFNKYFLNIGGTDRQDCLNTSLVSNSKDSIFFLPINAKQVENLIINLKAKKSKGIDGISNNLIKEAKRYLIYPLTYLINLMFSEGIFPEKLKLAIVRVKFKSGDKLDMKNYRPIAIISAIAKVFESAIHTQLATFLENKSLLMQDQYGFRNNRGTQEALTTVINYIYSALNMRQYIGLVALDMSKAFDVVDHKKLLEKLYALGIRGHSLKLLQSYLLERKQAVRIGNTESVFRNVKKGVPQGSILGPLLFIIYVNDLMHIVGLEKLVMYADDILLMTSDIDKDQIKIKLEKSANLIIDWCKVNNMSINNSKSKFLLIESPWRKIKQDKDETFIVIENTKFYQSNSLKYLGIIIDKNMNWIEQHSMVRSKLARVIGIFYRLRDIFSKQVLMIIYYALFQSVILYGILNTFNCANYKINNLYKLQKKGIKIINFKDRYFKINNTMAEEGILSVYALFLRENVKILYKVLQGQCKIEGIQVNRLDHTNQCFLRSTAKGKFIVPVYINDYGKYSLCVRLPKIGNLLIDWELDINNAKSMSILLHNFKKIILKIDVVEIMNKI